MSKEFLNDFLKEIEKKNFLKKEYTYGNLILRYTQAKKNKNNIFTLDGQAIKFEEKNGFVYFTLL